MKSLFLTGCIEVAFLQTPSFGYTMQQGIQFSFFALHNLLPTVFSSSVLSNMAYWKEVHSEVVYITERPTNPGSRAVRTKQKMHSICFFLICTSMLYMSSLEARGMQENATVAKRSVVRKSILIENHRKTTKYRYDIFECWFKHSWKCPWTVFSLPNDLMVDRPDSDSDSLEYIGLHVIISREHCMMTEGKNEQRFQNKNRC